MFQAPVRRRLAAAVAAKSYRLHLLVARNPACSRYTTRPTPKFDHGQQQQQFDGDVEGVEPQVSLYARCATAILIGGVSYYVYSEHGHRIARHLPSWAHGSSGSQASSESEEQQSHRPRRRLREALVPKSPMTQLDQVRWAWSHPGLYVVGSNEYGLANPLHPGSGTGFKASVPVLEGRLLRAAAFACTHAAAVDANGNLYQWGTGFTGHNQPHMPQSTLRDPAIVAMAASPKYIVLLDRKSRIRLVRGETAASPGVSQLPDHPLLFEPSLGWREHVVAVSAGEDHVAATTSAGHVYTCALSPNGNNRCQLGYHGESTTVQPFVLRRIQSTKPFGAAVCGGQHTLFLTTEGDVWGCGANDFGQLAMGRFSEANRTVRNPTPLRSLWAATSSDGFQPALAHAVKVAAGARTSYFVVERNGSNGSVEVLASGCGIDGQLGSGAHTHMQGRPLSIAALSGRIEVDPVTGQRRPVGIRTLSVSGDHAVAVSDNHTNVVPNMVSSVEPLFGYDVMVWGSNSSGQCIPDRKHRFSEPEHPPPLYVSTTSAKSNGLNVPPLVRLQAAPRQWVPASGFMNLEPGTAPKSKKHLVEQEFIAGPDVTAAFLKG